MHKWVSRVYNVYARAPRRMRRSRGPLRCSRSISTDIGYFPPPLPLLRDSAMALLKREAAFWFPRGSLGGAVLGGFRRCGRAAHGKCFEGFLRVSRGNGEIVLGRDLSIVICRRFSEPTSRWSWVECFWFCCARPYLADYKPYTDMSRTPLFGTQFCILNHINAVGGTRI